MKKQNLVILLFVAIFASCNNSKTSSNINSDALVVNTDTTLIVGNDSNEHGCKASAGYIWSVLKKTCVRIFESGSKFEAAGENKDSTMAAYIIINENKDSAEVFLPNSKPFIALSGDATNGILFESKSNSVFISANNSSVNILKGKNVVFSQPKNTGIGKLLDLK
jgi:hypothetical protein